MSNRIEKLQKLLLLNGHDYNYIPICGNDHYDCLFYNSEFYFYASSSFLKIETLNNITKRSTRILDVRETGDIKTLKLFEGNLHVYEINLHGFNLENVDILSELNFPNLKVLYLGINSIRTLPRLNFLNLESLYIFDNPLSSIEGFLESDLPKLKTININPHIRLKKKIAEKYPNILITS